MQREIENLRDGHAYELPGLLLGQIVKSLTDERKSEIVCRQLKVQDDIIEPLRRHERIQLSAWQASRQLKELGFTLERIGGQNKFTPTLESLRRAAEKIGYQDNLLHWRDMQIMQDMQHETPNAEDTTHIQDMQYKYISIFTA